jgi:hypothetical protein
MFGNSMTAPRQQRNPRQRWASFGPILALIGALMGGGIAVPGGPSRVEAATGEMVVVDRHSGLAISGFDPVAYFTDRSPIAGRGEFEASFAGAVWRFRNSGNREAFVADPEVYMPQFGGYDPVAVARGVAVPGDPRLWLVRGERLYLFYSAGAREAFAADSERIVALADRAWPSVTLTLSP